MTITQTKSGRTLVLDTECHYGMAQAVLELDTAPLPLAQEAAEYLYAEETDRLAHHGIPLVSR